MNTESQQSQQGKPTAIRWRNDVALAVLIILLGIGVFLFFKSFFDTSPNSLATEILAAFLGSIITVMITMLLIRQQGTVEQAQAIATTSKTRIFDKKLELFREFTKYYVKCAVDGDLNAGELEKLEARALTIFLLADGDAKKEQENLGEKLCEFVLQLQQRGLPKPEDRDRIRFVDILKLMKIELGVSQVTDADDIKSRSAQALLSYREYRTK